jgi:hypothetical protein
MIWRIAGALIALVLIYALGMTAWRALHPPPEVKVIVSASSALPAPAVVPPKATAPAAALDATVPLAPSGAPAQSTAPCAAAPKFTAAAAQNAASLGSAPWSVFGRAETGWEIYAPLVAQEIGTFCTPAMDGFAAALAAWQSTAALPPTGVMDAATLKAMNVKWLRRRPFVAAFAHGACPPPPAPDALAWMTPDEGYSGKAVQLRAAALTAYRAMVAAARMDDPALAADHRLLTVFSGYRDPVSDAARCAKDGNCGTVAKANCSAHRTGLAMDLYLGSAPGFAPESSADANRLYQSRSAAYRWLAANAWRFGFVPYPFEPWHWEWTGEPI